MAMFNIRPAAYSAWQLNFIVPRMVERKRQELLWRPSYMRRWSYSTGYNRTVHASTTPGLDLEVTYARGFLATCCLQHLYVLTASRPIWFAKPPVVSRNKNSAVGCGCKSCLPRRASSSCSSQTRIDETRCRLYCRCLLYLSFLEVAATFCVVVGYV